MKRTGKFIARRWRWPVSKWSWGWTFTLPRVYRRLCLGPLALDFQHPVVVERRRTMAAYRCEKAGIMAPGRRS